MRYGAPDWDAVVAALEEASEVAIACHVNPDGDALGSLFGASLALRTLDKRTYASWGVERPSVPPQYRFLPGSSTLLMPEHISAGITFLALDCGGADRLGTLEDTARGAPRLINIDHHPGNDNFGHLNIVVEGASSTAELVTWLLRDLGVAIDVDIATCLYTGIVTDTGRFQYANAAPDTLRLAADLLGHGVDASQVALEVFESSPFSFLKLVGHMLERATLVPEVSLVFSWITSRDLADTGVAIDETEKLIDILRSTRDADVAAMFKQQPDGSFRASLRSKGPGVGAIARAHGGGGHDLAAGFTASDVASAVEDIRRALSD